MSKPFFLAVAGSAAAAIVLLAAAPSAEAHRYRHRGGVSVVIGAPLLYGGYGYYNPRYNGYAPYGYRRYDPVCRRWGWVYSRSGKAKRRCIAW